MLLNPFVRHRNASIVASVLLLHGLALWGLQSGLAQRLAAQVEELVVPVATISAPPVVPKPPPTPAKTPHPIAPAQVPPMPATPTTQTSLAPTTPPMPQAMVETALSSTASAGIQHEAVLPSAPPTPAPKLELPSSAADYLRNPKPRYPPLSISRNEQGTVVLLVLVGADGKAKEAKIKTSSGFVRLDNAAHEAVMGWTFVPGKRGGVPEDMWYEIPMPFRLTE